MQISKHPAQRPQTSWKSKTLQTPFQSVQNDQYDTLNNLIGLDFQKVA